MKTRVSGNGLRSYPRPNSEPNGFTAEGVETAIGPSRTDEGTVQTTNTDNTKCRKTKEVHIGNRKVRLEPSVATKVVVVRKCVDRKIIPIRFRAGLLTA